MGQSEEDFSDFHPSAGLWLNDADALLDRAIHLPDQIIDELAQVDADDSPRHYPLIDLDCVGAALFDSTGSPIVASAVFGMEMAEAHIDPDLIQSVLKSGQIRVVAIERKHQVPALFVYAPARMSTGWRLPSQILDEVSKKPESVVVVATLSHIESTPFDAACASFGLTELQRKVIIATIKSGNIKVAAHALGIAYQTARETISQAMRRVGATRLSGLVHRLSTLAFGILPKDENAWSLLADIWGLSGRQASLAVLMASGCSRTESAEALNISESVAKKEIKNLFAILDVPNATVLARVMAEARAIQALTYASSGDIGVINSRREPLKFTLRKDRSRIAWSDYGPPNGKPVLLIHSSMTTRHVSRRLLTALQSRGFRPIAIDRPGFGLSDPLAGHKAGEHDPFKAAVADVLSVMAHLKLKKIAILARGGAHHVLAIHAAAPTMLDKVVLVNPDPDSQSDPRRVGPLGAVKEAYIRRPALVRLVAKGLSTQLTFEKAPRLLGKTLEGSPPDQQAIKEPDIFEDYFRSLRPFATGRYEGYINEQIAHATHGRPAPVTGTSNWHFVVGEYDTLYDPDFVIGYWRQALPDAKWSKVPDAGRLLAMTHSDLVAELLL